jgi:glutamate racemase
MSALPIGVFDSGVGGLTVLRALAKHFPLENFIYLGDTARLPYGTKSPVTIRAYSEQVMNFMIGRGVKAIIIACNSASSQVTETEWKGLPVYSVIKPGAEAALSVTKTLKVGVLGTRATIESGVYPTAINAMKSGAEVFSVAAPLLVPLAEEGWTNDSITDLVVARYVESLLEKQIDTLILGCTHYPLLKDSLRKICGPDIKFVDSGDALAAWIERDLESGRLKPSQDLKRTIKVFKTDLSNHAQAMTRKILVGFSIESIEGVDLK